MTWIRGHWHLTRSTNWVEEDWFELEEAPYLAFVQLSWPGQTCWPSQLSPLVVKLNTILITASRVELSFNWTGPNDFLLFIYLINFFPNQLFENRMDFLFNSGTLLAVAGRDRGGIEPKVGADCHLFLFVWRQKSSLIFHSVLFE